MNKEINIESSAHLEKNTIRDCSFHEYGVIIDIGTTTVESCLFDLDMKKEVIRLSKNNPQRVYGADVISRISYGNQSEEHLKKLNHLIWDCCNQIIDELLIKCELFQDNSNRNKSTDSAYREFPYNKIKKVLIFGNAVMSQIFLGRSLEGFTRVPFSHVNYDVYFLLGKDGKLNINPEGEIIVLPGIHGHVGSDTIGSILAVNLGKQRGRNLLIDIGTNGEIVFSQDGKMVCCSTAAGPVFEGASLYQGMKAIEGAIRGIHIENYNVNLDVIGRTDPVGICGSGVIDAIGELIKTGIIDQTGRMLSADEVHNPLRSRLIQDKGMRFILGSSRQGENVVLTQQDVREVQLAKAAIYAGIISLLEAFSIESNQIDNLYIAGALGSNMNTSNAIAIKLLPNIDRRRIKFIGNGVITGGKKILSKEYPISEIISLSKEIRHIELANDGKFQKRYIDAINF